jgi:hypothetical protein
MSKSSAPIRKQDSGPFAVVQSQQVRIVAFVLLRHDLQPRRWRRDPSAYALWSRIMLQFIPDDFRHEYFVEKGW